MTMLEVTDFFKKFKSTITRWYQTDLQVNYGFDFVERFSHELRTSLTGVVGYVEFIEQNANEPMINFASRVIHESGISSMRAASAYFDLTRLISGNMACNVSNFSVFEMLVNAVHQHQAYAHEMGITLLTSASPELSALIIKSDSFRLHQLLDILIYAHITRCVRGSFVHIELTINDQQSEFHLNLRVNQNPQTNHEMFLRSNFWLKRDYQFELQEGPGVELAYGKELIYFLRGQVAFSSAQDLQFLVIKLPI